MRRGYFFLSLVAFFMFLYIGPVNLAPYPMPSAIPTENNVLSDAPQIGEVVLSEFGSNTYLGGGQWSYSSVMGMSNTLELLGVETVILCRINAGPSFTSEIPQRVPLR